MWVCVLPLNITALVQKHPDVSGHNLRRGLSSGDFLHTLSIYRWSDTV